MKITSDVEDVEFRETPAAPGQTARASLARVGDR
jgi:hypothetical protein